MYTSKFKESKKIKKLNKTKIIGYQIQDKDGKVIGKELFTDLKDALRIHDEDENFLFAINELGEANLVN